MTFTMVTGGSGLLGTELQKHIKCMAPDRNYLDITKPTFFDALGPIPTLIIHCAAYTDVAKAEEQRDLCYQTNVISTRNLAGLGIPMLYISTEYVFDGERGNYAETDYPNPVNFYALTKLLGEYEARRTRNVVVRCLFKPRPFEHPAACVDQYTSGDYVDVIAKEIALAAQNFDRLPPVVHIGTGRKSIYDLAIMSRDVRPIRREEIAVKLPGDVSLDTTLWENFKREHRLCTV